MALGPTQGWTPFHGGTPDFQGIGGNKYEIAKSPFASGNSIQMGGAPGGAGTPSPGADADSPVDH